MKLFVINKKYKRFVVHLLKKIYTRNEKHAILLQKCETTDKLILYYRNVSCTTIQIKKFNVNGNNSIQKEWKLYNTVFFKYIPYKICTTN